MEKILINGGNKLSGSVKIESAKNSVLPLMAASILTKEQVVIKNCPKIYDVLNMAEILNTLGVRTYFDGNNLIIDAKALDGYSIPKHLAEKLRSSVFMMGALIARQKRASISFPGGCDIGARPIDIHISALKSLGTNVSEEEDKITCIGGYGIGCKIYLKYPSVGATENAMMAAVLARGKTEIHNAAKEPEIIDLMKFLNSMGAKVYGAGTSIILIEGVKNLHGTEYKPLSDRIEAGTYLLSAAITGGEVELKNASAKNISPLIHKLCDNTCKLSIKDDIIYIKSGRERKAFSFSTGPYPFFPTDLQAQTTALLCVSSGQSTVIENVFEKRFGHVLELTKMGAQIKVSGKVAHIQGVPRLFGAAVTAGDLRGGAALVLAGLNAEGQTLIDGAHHVKRGYLDIDKKFAALGADIKFTQ